MAKSVSLILFISGLTCCVTAQCTPGTPTGNPGFSPPPDSIACVVKGAPYYQVLQIENFTTIAGITMIALRIDSIGNLPAGLTFQKNPADGIIGAGETGCILISGTTSDSAGAYLLDIFVRYTIRLGGDLISIPQNPDESIKIGDFPDNIGPMPLADSSVIYYLTVIEPDSNCPNMVYTSTSNDVKQIKSSVYPNPATDKIKINWSKPLKEAEVRIMDVTGNTVLEATASGKNIDLDVAKLQNGIYFYYMLENGQHVSQGNFIIVR